MSFKDLKKNSAAQFDKLTAELEKLNKPSYSTNDDKYWTCETDKLGNGYAVIRFLPAPENEDVPFVRYWSHGFKGPGGWYIENSLTTLGQQDPCGELNSKLWNSGLESDKEIARKQKRGTNYVSNIYIIKDPANPDNEGKVFLYRYGAKIFGKLNDLMHPQFEDEQKIDPFNFWEGATFKLKVRKVEGYPNYDKSEFEKPEPLFEDDDKLEEVYGKLHSLKAVVDPKNFKSYEELQTRLNKVLGLAGQTTQRSAPEAEPAKQRERFAQNASSEEPAGEVTNNDDDAEDADLAFFRKMASED